MIENTYVLFVLERASTGTTIRVPMLYFGSLPENERDYGAVLLDANELLIDVGVIGWTISVTYLTHSSFAGILEEIQNA